MTPEAQQEGHAEKTGEARRCQWKLVVPVVALAWTRSALEVTHATPGVLVAREGAAGSDGLW